MKKALFSVFVTLFIVLFVSCGPKECVHEWEDATCQIPKTCSLCGATDGDVLHLWVDATCEMPKTCSACGMTEGEALGHKTTAGICDVCGINYGFVKLCEKLLTCPEVNGKHRWVCELDSAGNPVSYIVLTDDDQIKHISNVTTDDGSGTIVLTYMEEVSIWNAEMNLNMPQYGIWVIVSGEVYPSSYSSNYRSIKNIDIDTNFIAKYYIEDVMETTLEKVTFLSIKEISEMAKEIGLTMEDLGFVVFDKNS